MYLDPLQVDFLQLRDLSEEPLKSPLATRLQSIDLFVQRLLAGDDVLMQLLNFLHDLLFHHLKLLLVQLLLAVKLKKLLLRLLLRLIQSCLELCHLVYKDFLGLLNVLEVHLDIVELLEEIKLSLAQLVQNVWSIVFNFCDWAFTEVITLKRQMF